MTSPATGARPDDDRRTGSTTPVDGAPRRPRQRLSDEPSRMS